MSAALPGAHYCDSHQGNHSHYAEHNCEMCRLAKELAQAKEQLASITPVGWIQEVVDGRQFLHAGDLDPREVHDNGKPCYRIYRIGQGRGK